MTHLRTLNVKWKKEASPVLSFAPILINIWFYVLIQDRKDRDMTELFVNFTNRAFERNLGFGLIYFYFTVSVRFFSPQQLHFPNLIKSLSQFLCSHLVHQMIVLVSTMQHSRSWSWHQILWHFLLFYLLKFYCWSRF